MPGTREEDQNMYFSLDHNHAAPVSSTWPGIKEPLNICLSIRYVKVRTKNRKTERREERRKETGKGGN